MINPGIFGIVFIVVAAASLGLVITGFQSTMASSDCVTPVITNEDGIEDADVDVLEAAEAGNATMAGAANQTTTNGNTTEFLSIQSAQSGSISQINATAYILELKNVANDTIQFSDRPSRIVETVSTSNFVGNWTTGLNSFSADAPNDALIVEDTQTGNLQTYVIESFSPVYDTNTNTLTYTIVTENGTPISLPGEFGQAVLVIDYASSTIPCAGCVIQVS